MNAAQSWAVTVVRFPLGDPVRSEGPLWAMVCPTGRPVNRDRIWSGHFPVRPARRFAPYSVNRIVMRLSRTGGAFRCPETSTEAELVVIPAMVVPASTVTECNSGSVRVPIHPVSTSNSGSVAPRVRHSVEVLMTPARR